MTVRIVVLGYGPVAARLVEGLLPAVRAGSVTLAVVGAEVHDAYNRVLVADYAVGRASRERLEVTETDAARAAGVDVRLGVAAIGIDRARQSVRLDDDTQLAYDRLVFAVGSRANIPTLHGLEDTRHRHGVVARTADEVDRGRRPLPLGVRAMRTLDDAAALRERILSGTATSVIVLGAGVLGMELALAAVEAGASASIVYQDGIPMGRTLDEGGGRVLARISRQAGVATIAHARAEEVVLRHDDRGRARFHGLLCADGVVITGDELVLSCGVTARTELAESAGLRTAAGIVVDEQLRSWTDPAVFAIGDCAQIVDPGTIDPALVADPAARIPGRPSGLIGPGWRQADWLAAQLSAEAAAGARPAALGPERIGPERVGVVMLKAEGVDLVAAGEVRADPWDDGGDGGAAGARRVAVWADPAAGRYAKLVGERGRVVGFVSVGMPRAGAELTLMFERGSELPDDASLLLRLDAADELTPPTALTPETVLCSCNAVTVQGITDAITGGCETVDAVGRATRAGTGCGGCRDKIQALIDSRSAVPVAAE